MLLNSLGVSGFIVPATIESIESGKNSRVLPLNINNARDNLYILLFRQQKDMDAFLGWLDINKLNYFSLNAFIVFCVILSKENKFYVPYFYKSLKLSFNKMFFLTFVKALISFLNLKVVLYTWLLFVQNIFKLR